MTKTGLGKGLSALIPTGPEISEKDDMITELDISLISPNAYQPRRSFDQDKLKELADSISEHGVVQPIIVRPLERGKYELVVGERRLRASQSLGMDRIPAVVKGFTNEQMMEIALVENIQRQDLNPIEEAMAYKRLMEEFGMTQEKLSQRISKSRSLIANMVRLLSLPQSIIDNVAVGEITVGHARTLLAIDDEATQNRLAQEIITQRLSVRETESLVKTISEEEKKRLIQKTERKGHSDTTAEGLSPTLKDIETKLRSLLSTKVKIKNAGNKGKIEIEYYNPDDLERIITAILKDDTL